MEPTRAYTHVRTYVRIETGTKSMRWYARTTCMRRGSKTPDRAPVPYPGGAAVTIRPSIPAVQVRPYHTHTAAHPSCCCSSMQESRAGTPIPEVVPPLPYPDKPRGAGVFAVDAVVAEPAAGAMHGTGVFAVAGGGHPSNPAADLPGDWRRAPHASDPAGRPPLGDRIGAVVASRWPAWSWSGVRCIVAPARPKCLPRTER
jgi:hypothetical protein